VKKSSMDLVVGASILLALFILIAGVLWLKEVSITRRMVSYTVLFPNIGALQGGDGVMVNGDHGRFHWALASQNGALINDSSQRVTGSVRVNLIGQRELPWEGAYRAGDQTRLTAGIAVSDDDSVSEGLAWNADLYLIHQRFSFAAEIVDYEEGYSLDVPLEQRGDTTPWSATPSSLLVPETYEVALRYDDFDDRSQPLDYDRKLWTVGLNRYIRGHELKWQLNYQYADFSGSEDGDSGSRIALGLTASF